MHPSPAKTAKALEVLTSVFFGSPSRPLKMQLLQSDWVEAEKIGRDHQLTSQVTRVGQKLHCLSHRRP